MFKSYFNGYPTLISQDHTLYIVIYHTYIYIYVNGYVQYAHIDIIQNYKALVNILIKSSRYCLKQNGENSK